MGPINFFYWLFRDKGGIKSTNVNTTKDQLIIGKYLKGKSNGEIHEPFSISVDEFLKLVPNYSVKRYLVFLTQSGTDAPVPTEVQNTLGGVPTYSYIGPATYWLKLTGAFPSNKTIAIPGGQSFNTGSDDPPFAVSRIDDDTIEIAATGDGYLNGAFLLIEVYP